MKIEEKKGKLLITDFDEFEAYRIAVAIEKDGIQFYEKLRESSLGPKVKGALEFLKKEEARHLSIFEQLLQEMRDRGADSSEDNDILSGMHFGIFEPYRNIQDLHSALKSTEQAIKLGLIIEKKSIAFYQACKDKVSSGKVVDELARIIKQEERHKALLEGMLEG